ncbi:MAG: hypothetical protein ACTSRG_23445 [Candidatus Helarchaeota archaeon]
MVNLINIQGHKFHIAGSANENVNRDVLKKTHIFVKELVGEILQLGGGFTITAKEEPLIFENLPLIFDWTIIEAIVGFLEKNSINWPNFNQKPITIIVYHNFKAKIPDRRIELWKRLLDFNEVGLKKELLEEDSVGEELRKEQAKDGDILITLGGKKGVSRLVRLYQEEKKSIIPIGVDLGTNLSYKLTEQAKNQPELFFICEDPERINSLFINLPTNPWNPDRELIGKLLHLIDSIFSLATSESEHYKKIILDQLFISLQKLQLKQNILRESEDHFSSFIVELLNSALKQFNLNISEQKFGGHSANKNKIKGPIGGLGKLDFIVEDSSTGEIITICEALVIKDYKKNSSNIIKHLTKLFNYDLIGLQFNIIIAYVKDQNFNKAWERYLDIVKNKTNFRFKIIGLQDKTNELSKSLNIRIAISLHDWHVRRHEVYHFFVNLD